MMETKLGLGEPKRCCNDVFEKCYQSQPNFEDNFANVHKGYLRCKMITSSYVSSEAQVKNFFIS